MYQKLLPILEFETKKATAFTELGFTVKEHMSTENQENWVVLEGGNEPYRREKTKKINCYLPGKSMLLTS